MAKIQIRISPTGEIQAETIGVKGKQCLKYISVIERLTDAVVADSEFTGEYLESPVTQTAEDFEEVTI